MEVETIAIGEKLVIKRERFEKMPCKVRDHEIDHKAEFKKN